MLRQLLLLFPVFFLVLPTSQAQEPPNYSTPYHSMYTHLQYLQPETYRPDIAAKALVSVQDSARRVRLAVQLKQVLDGKGLYVQLNQVPRDPNYYDSTRQESVYVPFPLQLPEVYLSKNGGRWQYAQETVEAIPALHQSVYPLGADLLLNLVPRFGQQTFLGLQIWQYLGILLLGGVVFLLHFLLSRLFRPLVHRLMNLDFMPKLLAEQTVRRLAKLLSLILLLQFCKWLVPPLQLPVRFNEFVMLALNLAFILLVVLIGLRLASLIVDYFRRFSERTESRLDEQLVPIVKKTLQAIVVLGGIIQALYLLDVNVTALIAGISLGGLALALAAQDTVKNLIGSATIFVDQPFQVGDWIEGSGFAGTVVEVGIRTTRIQPVDTSIISVPNGQIVNMNITNLGVRNYRMFNLDIGILYSTPPDLIEAFLGGLKQVILQHPDTWKDTYYVRLADMGASSLNIMFRTWIDVPTYVEEKKVSEELIFAILRLAERIGVGFAFPSTSLYVESMPGSPQPVNKELPQAEEVNAFLKDYQAWLRRRE